MGGATNESIAQEGARVGYVLRQAVWLGLVNACHHVACQTGRRGGAMSVRRGPDCDACLAGSCASNKQ